MFGCNITCKLKRFIVAAHEVSHVELTTLIVPDENESEEEMDALSAWVAEVDPHIVLNLSRFFPRANALDKPPTDKSQILRLCQTARRHMKYVFPGNM